jgi:hypothetical protein
LALVCGLGRLSGWTALVRSRGNRWKELAKGLTAGIGIAGTLTLIMPQLAAAYSLNNLSSDLFSAEPCTVRPDRATLRIEGAGLALAASYDIRHAPTRGEDYWIVSFSYSSTPQSYFAKRLLTREETTVGHHDQVEIRLRPGTAPNSMRKFWIVCANPTASADLREFLDQQGPPARSGELRRGLPEGTMKISNGVANTTSTD